MPKYNHLLELLNANAHFFRLMGENNSYFGNSTSLFLGVHPCSWVQDNTHLVPIIHSSIQRDCHCLLWSTLCNWWQSPYIHMLLLSAKHLDQEVSILSFSLLRAQGSCLAFIPHLLILRIQSGNVKCTYFSEEKVGRTMSFSQRLLWQRERKSLSATKVLAIFQVWPEEHLHCHGFLSLLLSPSNSGSPVEGVAVVGRNHGLNYKVFLHFTLLLGSRITQFCSSNPRY